MLEVRKNVKRRKPSFIRQDAHKKVRVKESWRSPKGWNSKMRKGFKGYRKSVTAGYKSPASVRGLTRDGFEMVWVSRKEDLVGLDPKKQALVITSGTGTRKKISILEAAIEKGFKVTNFNNAQDYLNRINEALDKKKKQKQKHQKVKKEKEKEKEEASRKKEEEEKKEETQQESAEESKETEKEGKKSLDDITGEEEKKKQEEKKEKDKVLTKKS